MAHVPMKRSLSIKSEETLNKLGSFEKQLVEMETRFATYSALLDRYNSTGRWASSDPELAIVSVKTALETMVGKLDALQFQKLDSIQTVELHSGKEAAKVNRKNLNQRTESLLASVKSAHVEISAILAKR